MADTSFFSGIVEGSGFAIGETIITVAIVAVAAAIGMSKDGFLQHIGTKVSGVFRKTPATDTLASTESTQIDQPSDQPPALRRWPWIRGIAWLIVVAMTTFLAWHDFIAPQHSVDGKASTAQPKFTQAQVDEKIAAATASLQKQLAEANRTRPTSQPTLTPEQVEFSALSQINKNLSVGDRQRLSDALFDFSKFLDRANQVFGEANMAGAEYVRNVQSGAIATDFDEEHQKLEQIIKKTIELKKDFDAVRSNWKFYQKQRDYIFGREPDNLALKLQNGVSHLSNFLEWWGQIENKKNDGVLRLLYSPTTTFNELLTGFAQWQQGCQRRLQQMQDTIQ